MKRVLVLFIVSILINFSALYGISVREYIQEHGVPPSEDGVLDLSSKNITNLEGLENIPQSDTIRVLNLSSNKIHTVPAGIFAYFSQLHTLNLSWNKIKMLPEDIFMQLSNLSRLNLGDNNLYVLPENIFKHLTQLRILELQGNYLSVLPQALFTGLTILIVDFARNWFKETTCEFRQKYLTCMPNCELIYKDNKQELKENIQNYLLERISPLTVHHIQEQEMLVCDALLWLQKPLFWYDPYCDDAVPMQDDQGNTLLHKAVQLCNPLLVKTVAKLFLRLLQVKNNQGQTPMHVGLAVEDTVARLAIIKVLEEISVKTSCSETSKISLLMQ